MFKNFFLLLFFSVNIFAEAINFSGFNMEISAGFQKSGADAEQGIYINGEPEPAALVSSFSQSDFISSIGASYSFYLNKDYLLGMGLDYYLSDIQLGEPTTCEIGFSCHHTIKTEIQNMYVFYLNPQFVIDTNKLLYLKLGYVSADLKYDDSDAETIHTKNTNLDGYLFGLGLKKHFKNNFYGFTEANYINFNDDKFGGIYNHHGNLREAEYKSNIDAVNFKLGIGYQF